MSQRSTKVAGQKATAVRQASGTSKESKAAQKQLAPKDAAKPPRSRHHVSLPDLTSSDEEEFDLDHADEADDAPPKSEEPQHCDVFNPAPSQRTKDTPKSGREALDVNYFFTERVIEGTKLRVCNLCADVHGYEKKKHPTAKNYMYGISTGKGNCRKHLRALHPDIYDKTVLEKEWPYPLSTEVAGTTTTVADMRRRTLPQFTPGAFLDYLVRFIVADDQSVRVIECPEFRDLCMVLRGSLQDSDIPHRDKVREAIIDKWGKWFDDLKEELSHVAGRISFTADVWSSGSLCSYLALTCHWISEREGGLSLKTALIGFHRLKKRHTGKNLARTILHLLDRANVTEKIGYFTLDNASNNDSAMKELECLLKKRHIGSRFDHSNNRVRCFPHIIDVCVSHLASCERVSKEYLKFRMSKAKKKALPKAKNNDGDDDSDDYDSDDYDSDDYDYDDYDYDDYDYADADADNADNRNDDKDYDFDDDFDDYVYDNDDNGNVSDDDDDRDDDSDDDDNCKDKWFQDVDLKKFSARRKAWFLDMKRDPVRRARKVVRHLRSSDQRRLDFEGVIVNGNKIGRFKDVNASLTQIPSLEPLRDVTTRWDSTYTMIERLLVLRPAIEHFFKLYPNSAVKLTGRDWELLKLLGRVLEVPHQIQHAMSGESMPVLSSAVALFELFMSEWEDLRKECPELAPWITIGLKWARKYYRLMDNTDAYIVTMVLNPCIRFRWISEQWDSYYNDLARNKMLSIMADYRRKQSSGGASRPPVAVRGPAPATPRKAPTQKQMSIFSDSKRPSLAKRIEKVFGGRGDASCVEGTPEDEFTRYVSGLPSPPETDILRFWEMNRGEFPTLYSIARDYLPIQASSVPCERVFSSAKETDTLKRNRILPVFMEALQMLKFSLKKDRQLISFTEGWKTARAELRRADKEDLLAKLIAAEDRQVITDAVLSIVQDQEDDEDSDAGDD